MTDHFAALAIEAGRAILAIRARGAHCHLKGDGSPVTEADEAAEAILSAGLGALLPDVPLVAEEAAAAGRVPEIGPRFLLVDPLDGTREFISGSGEFTVNIALVENEFPIAGVVYAPALGALYAGHVGLGARAAIVDLSCGNIGDKISWSPIAVRDAAGRAPVAIGSRSHLTQETKDYVTRHKLEKFVSVGSSLKFCRVAEGAADLYPRLGRTMEWDTAAGDAILRAAGGRVVTLDGAPLVYGKRGQATDSDFANPWFIAAGGIDPLI
ncbi:3'(2'),5'-bisphosphate nucleotidase CysQ [Segnochrobactraceae bacterium EtOH-i3]